MVGVHMLCGMRSSFFSQQLHNCAPITYNFFIQLQKIYASSPKKVVTIQLYNIMTNAVFPCLTQRKSYTRLNNPLFAGALAVRRGFFGQGSGKIYLDALNCQRDEARLDNCSHSGIGVHQCEHNTDAGVICQSMYMYIPLMHL